MATLYAVEGDELDSRDHRQMRIKKIAFQPFSITEAGIR
jgi:hypothetical protein